MEPILPTWYSTRSRREVKPLGCELKAMGQRWWLVAPPSALLFPAVDLHDHAVDLVQG